MRPGKHSLRVVAVQDGETDFDQIEIDVGWSSLPPANGRLGDHSASIGAWPSHGRVQALDGVAAGLQSVAVPGLVARILSGTGRVNVGQGAVMTVQGVGASLSPALGGAIAQAIGFQAAFLILGSFAIGSLALWILAASILRPACARPADEDGASASPATA